MCRRTRRRSIRPSKLAGRRNWSKSRSREMLRIRKTGGEWANVSGVGCWSHSQQEKNVGARRRHGKQRIAKERTRRCEVTNGEYVNEDVLKPDRRQQQSSVRSNLGFALVVLRQMYPIPDRSKDPRSAFVGTEERNQKWRQPTGCSSRKVGGERGCQSM